jgi:glucokinase
MRKYYGGIDLGGSFIKAGLISPEGEAVSSLIVPTLVEKGIPAVKANLREVGKKLAEMAVQYEGELVGIGVGSPGTIRHPEGIVTGASPNIPGWQGTNISEIFSDIPFKVVADNDANCMGLAEALFGAGKGTLNGFYLTIGTGIGGAIIINGALYRGASYCAGEFGHTVFVYNGAKCKTGRRGCLEQYINAAALVSAAAERVKAHPESALAISSELLTPKMIFEMFNQGDPAAVEAVSENAAMLGTAIGSTVNLLNPEIVVIGGGMALGGERYIELIKKAIFKFAFESTTLALRVELAKFGNEAGWIGAACLNIV